MRDNWVTSLSGSNIPAGGAAGAQRGWKPDVPGILCKHGCCYMACRGLVTAPLGGVLVLTHGPIGCAWYSWDSEREAPQDWLSTDGFTHCFSTDMQETDVIFGGQDTLRQAIREAVETFHPAVIAICATCPVGLIGDDVEKVAREAEAQYGIRVIGYACEGFKDKPGFHLAGPELVRRCFHPSARKMDTCGINLIGEFYVGRNREELGALFTEAGFTVVSALLGAGAFDDLQNGGAAGLTVQASDKPVDNLAEMISAACGIDWMKGDFFGVTNLRRTLEEMRNHFGAQARAERVEAALARHVDTIRSEWDRLRARFGGKTAAMMEDGFNSAHYRDMLADLGVRSLTFRDISAPGRYRERYDVSGPAALMAFLCGRDESDMPGSLELDYAQAAALLGRLCPDLCLAGVADELAYGGACVQPRAFNSEDHDFPYAGFGGFLLFGQELERAVALSEWENSLPLSGGAGKEARQWRA